jgi:hypothetical protein
MNGLKDRRAGRARHSVRAENIGTEANEENKALRSLCVLLLNLLLFLPDTALTE